MMTPLELAPLSQAQVDELDTLYRTTKDVRLRTRSQMILLAAEQKMTAPTIAAVWENNQGAFADGSML